MVEVLTPNEETRKEFFISAMRMNRRAKKQVHDRGSLRWFRMESMSICLALFVIFVITILEEILNARLCYTSKAYQVSVIVTQVLSFGSTIVALMALIRLYLRFRKEFPRHKASAKVLDVQRLRLANYSPTTYVNRCPEAFSKTFTNFGPLISSHHGDHTIYECCHPDEIHDPRRFHVRYP